MTLYFSFGGIEAEHYFLMSKQIIIAIMETISNSAINQTKYCRKAALK